VAEFGYDLSVANAATSLPQNAGKSSGLRLDTNVFGQREHSTTSASTQLADPIGIRIREIGPHTRPRRDRPAAHHVRLESVGRCQVVEGLLLDAFGSDEKRNLLAIQCRCHEFSALETVMSLAGVAGGASGQSRRSRR
jgi:hypothetical protein